MTCDHSKWFYPPPVENDWTGELEDQLAYRVSACEDIDIGRYKCTLCGEVMYYTGQWKNYFEKGIPCAGSDKVKR